jgi:hypothetical protein
MITLQPIAEAVEKMSGKTPVGSTLKSAEWESVPREVRDRALFSSRVENARVLDRMKTGLQNILTGSRNEFGVIEDRTKFIAELGKLAEREGLSPSDPGLKGTIQDITSEARADLIVRTQTEMMYNAARHKRGVSGPLLRAAPAQELVRIAERKEKRAWVDTWRANGGRTFSGSPSIGGELQPGMGGIRCIALKGDPIWEAINRFGNPYPPFDFGSGVGVANVTRTEAIQLGLIQLGQEITSPQPALNENLEVDLGAMDPGIRNELLRGLEGLVELAGTILRWKGAAA